MQQTTKHHTNYSDVIQLYFCCRYWLSVGAQPSDPVQRILFRAGVLPPPPLLAMGRKGGPRDRNPIHPMTGRPLDLEGVKIVDDPNATEGGAEESTEPSLEA